MSLKVALTGSIGMGKSTVGKMFVERGIPLFEADEAVHRLYRSGPLVDAIEQLYPGSTGPQGVDRIKLIKILTAKGEGTEKIEAIVHPAVRKEREAFIAAHPEAPILLFDIPLLFETGGDAQMRGLPAQQQRHDGKDTEDQAAVTENSLFDRGGKHPGHGDCRVLVNEQARAQARCPPLAVRCAVRPIPRTAAARRPALVRLPPAPPVQGGAAG